VFKILCWVWGIGLVGMVILMLPPAPSKSQLTGSPAVQATGSPAVRADRAPDGVRLTDIAWTRDGFGTVMMLNFTIRNDRDDAVKDVTIKCVHTARSGTKIDSNTRTIYERVPAHSSLSRNQFNMGFFHDQTFESSCKVTDYAKA
jgi:hypothetical protein